MSLLNCVLVTPEETALDVQAEFIALPLYDGELGILPGHSPMIGRLGFGELRIRADGKLLRFYVDGGFVQVDGDVVSVLTNRALPAAEVDAASAREHLAAANRKKTTSDEEQELRDREIDQARAQLWVAERAD